MIISNSRKFIFVHVHKTAGSALKLALQPHLAWNDLVLGGTPLGEAVNDIYHDVFKLHKHSTIAEISKVCGPEIVESYYTFSIVRDPLARTVSLYNYIADLFRVEGRTMGIDHDEMRVAAREQNPKYAHHILEWSASRAYYSSENFSDFIRSPELAEDIGFRPQIEALQSRDRKLMVDQVFKHEHLLRDLPRIWDRVGCRFLLPVWNRPKVQKLKPENVSADDCDFLRRRFVDDYRAFDYE